MQPLLAAKSPGRDAFKPALDLFELAVRLDPANDDTIGASNKASSEHKSQTGSLSQLFEPPPSFELSASSMLDVDDDSLSLHYDSDGKPVHKVGSFASLAKMFASTVKKGKENANGEHSDIRENEEEHV